MKAMRRLWGFDWSRCRYVLLLWWLLCAVQAVVSFTQLFGENPDTTEHTGGLMLGSYLFLAILIGMTVQAGHPGRLHSFFQVKPVGTWALWRSRLVWIFVVVLGPLYLANLAPLLWVEPAYGPVSAFTVHFWALHGGAVCGLAAMAAASPKLSSYLLRALFGGGILLAVGGFFSRFNYRESNWWLVASPESAEILWQAGISVSAGLMFAAVCYYLYRGGRSWKVGVPVIASALLLAAAWGPIQFRTDIEKVGHPVGAAVDLSDVVYQAGRMRDLSAFEIQRNRGPGSYSVGGQSKPPYWNGGDELFWFVRGQFEIEGIDPELAYSARLLDARWIAADGIVLPYDPPSGTFSIRNSTHTLPPPMPTQARLDAIFGPMPDDSNRWGYSGLSGLLLFGAWTSDYERYKATPGRLELRVQVDFYQHVLAESFPLAEVGRTVRDAGRPLRLAGYTSTDEGLEIFMQKLVSTQRWHLAIEDRWSSGWRWMIVNPETGRRAKATGSGHGGASLGASIHKRRFSLEFQEWDKEMPDLSDPESLILVRIDPRYLGSAEVDVVVEDFPLVTQQSIDWALKDDLQPR